VSKFKGALDAIKQRKEEDQPKVGKRRDPNYQQITAYLPQDLYIEMKMALVQERKEMSDLFAELAQQWLKTRTAKAKK
jgi:hypothetical protein